MNSKNDTVQRPSKTLIFEVSDFDREVADVVPTIPPPARWSAFNAVRHRNNDSKIRKVNRETAFFRTITAEEEAATAIFHSLKRLRYPGASGLNPRNHVHKNAVAPFLHAVAMGLNQVPIEEFRGTLQFSNHDGRRAIQIHWELPWFPDGYHMKSPAPLNFRFSKRQLGQEPQLVDFQEQLAELAAQVKKRDIMQHIRDRANLRNQILYAGSEGYPGVSGNIDAGLREFQVRIFRSLRILLMIDPYRTHQEFVKQALVVFLDAVRVPPKNIQFD